MLKHLVIIVVIFLDPALKIEALQRDGIYPRESKHIYDPIHS